MKKKALLVAALVLCAAAVAVTQSPGPARPPGAQPRGPQIMGPTCPAAVLMVPPMLGNRPMEELNLTADQQAKLKDIVARSEEKLRGLRKAAADASREAFRLVLTPDADAAKIQSAEDAAVKADAEISRAEMDEWMQIRTVLTADQLKQVAEFMRPRRGMGMPGGPPNQMTPPGMNGGPPPGGMGAPPSGVPGGPPPGNPGGPPPGVEPPPPAPGQ